MARQENVQTQTGNLTFKNGIVITPKEDAGENAEDTEGTENVNPMHSTDEETGTTSPAPHDTSSEPSSSTPSPTPKGSTEQPSAPPATSHE